MPIQPRVFIFYLIYVTLVRSTSANENCRNNAYCAAIGQFDVTMEKKSETIELTWVFNSSKQAYSFQAFIYDSNSELYYESPKLHHSERSLIINKELEGGQNKVCLSVLYNNSEVLIEKCENFKETDLKILIGILAGTIFLIPCLVALVFIIYKDRKISQMQNYIKIRNKDDTGIEYAATADENLKGKTNIAFTEEAYPEKVSKGFKKTVIHKQDDNDAVAGQTTEGVTVPMKEKTVVEVDHECEESAKNKTRSKIANSEAESIYVIKL